MNDVHAQAKKGIKLLMGRQVFLQVLTFGGGVVLARVLDPAQFGLYAIATFLVSALALFGDFGLAPSLIQRKEDMTEDDLCVAFTLQQIVTTIIVALLLVLAPWLVHFYPKAPPEMVWLVRALAFSLYLTSWRTISALQLERQLSYDRLAWIEIGETFIYQVLVVGLALAGLGVWSFVWATIVRGVFGALAIFLAAPWKVRFRFDRIIAAEILRFGLPFQYGTILHSISGWITPVFVGGMIGPQAVGYLGWASSNGRKPLMLVDNVMRVAFPHFSRIQDDRLQVEQIMSKYLIYLLTAAGIWFVALLIAGQSLVHLIYTDKWQPALPALIIYAFTMSFDVIIWVVSVSMNACGFANLAAGRALVRTISQIILAVPLIHWIGYNGVPVAYLVTLVITLPWTFHGLGKGTMLRILRPTAWVIWPVLVSSVFGWGCLHLPLSVVSKAIVCSGVVLSVYTVTVIVTCPSWLRLLINQRWIRLCQLRYTLTQS